MDALDVFGQAKPRPKMGSFQERLKNKFKGW
jgi:hypothetical protein